MHDFHNPLDISNEDTFNAAAMQLPLRSAEEVMPLELLGTTKAYRLSFARTLVRRMVKERWQIEATLLDVDAKGIGTAIYEIRANGHQLYFLIFSDEVPEERRTGRLSETRFDGMGVLCHGPLTPEFIERQRREIIKRSNGRTDWQTLGWTLTSRSSRSYSYVVDCLASGRQPSCQVLRERAGYLFRNNGYYGNGRHGSRMWASLPDDHPLSSPYHPEMLALYMWRQFGFDLAEAMAAQRSTTAVRLDRNIKRYLGIGNATAQGISTFIVKWPAWMHAWNLVRETSIALVRQQPVTEKSVARTVALTERCRYHLLETCVDDNPHFLSHRAIIEDLDCILKHLHGVGCRAKDWLSVCRWAEQSVHRESLELLHAVLTEVYGDLVDRLDPWFAREMNCHQDIVPQMKTSELSEILDTAYHWAADLDLDDGRAMQHFFYRSEEHGEQRRGERAVDQGVEFETFTAVPALLRLLKDELTARPAQEAVSEFLIHHPEHRLMVQRVQSFAHRPFAEVHTNVPDAGFVPAHAIRFVLATFGMETFSALNHRWVQGTILQGAPIADDVASGHEEDWIYPLAPKNDG